MTDGVRPCSRFSTRSETYHARLRRSVNHAFALTTLLDYEPLVDSCTSFFLQRTQDLFVDTGRVCDLSMWMQYFAFDVIGEITWSKRLGFVEQDRDVSNIISTVESFINYGTVVGQNPWWDYLLVKNPIKLFLESKDLWPATPNAAIIKFAIARQKEAVATPPKDIKSTPSKARGVNFLQRFLQSQEKNKEFLSDDRIIAMCASLIIAGSDSTAISLSGVFYYLLENSRVYKKLMEEIDLADASGLLDSAQDTTGAGDVIPFPAANKLKYLDAVVNESFRMHPAVGLLLERVVPPQGATICGELIPGGTIVGCNAWVLHQNKQVFGDDAHIYRPERWLESEGADLARIAKMKSSMFHFGAGARTCIGRNISLMETYKLVPSFLRKFEVSFLPPDSAVDETNTWIARTRGIRGTNVLKERVLCGAEELQSASETSTWGV
jgi:cytochrome P450